MRAKNNIDEKNKEEREKESEGEEESEEARGREGEKWAMQSSARSHLVRENDYADEGHHQADREQHELGYLKQE